jgi:DNA polymerase III alpha subunit
VTGFPQLRVRSNFSIKKATGHISDLVERLEELQTPVAGLVDTGTWGHVTWEKELKGKSVIPAFGMEFPVTMVDGVAQGVWALATDLKGFYTWTSAHPVDIHQSDLRKLRDSAVVFSGPNLDDPSAFDYIDFNPRSLVAARQQLELYKKTGKPLVLTSDNFFARREDWDFHLAVVDQKRTTPQWLLSEQEILVVMNHLPTDILRAAIKGTYEAAERVKGLKLPRGKLPEFAGDLDAEIEAGKQYRIGRGHIVWTDAHEKRLQYERKMIGEKGFDSYFLIVGDLMRYAKTKMLVGPGRGSSSGSLVCYVLQITEIDPLQHDLLFERFIDVTRSDPPDVDSDFSDVRREMAFEYLREKYGEEHVARLGNVVTMQPRSVLTTCGMKMGVPKYKTFNLLNQLIEYSSGDSRYGFALEDTMIQTAEGKKFASEFPEMAVVGRAEQTPFTTSVHAAGVLVNDEPIHHYCTVNSEGVACLTKEDVKYLELLKIDALGLRTLGVLEECGVMSNQEFYDLKLDSQEAFDVINSGKFSGLFQLEGAAARRVAKQIPVTSFMQIAHIGGLARPGALASGGTNNYIKRMGGQESWESGVPEEVRRYTGDTFGVIVWQEQVMFICREIGKMSWKDVAEIRKSMSGRKGQEYFDSMRDKFTAGANDVIGEDAAREIWRQMVFAGSWLFNVAHAVSYGIVTYWTAYVKARWPLQYAAALLSNAKDDEQVIEMLRELRDEGISYVAFDPDKSDAGWSVRDGVLYGGYQNIKGIGPAKAGQYLARRKAGQLTDVDRKKLLSSEIRFRDLEEGKKLWGAVYANPELHGIRGKVKLIGKLKDGEEAVVIAKLIRRERRDENEAVRFQRRGNKAYMGRDGSTQSLFLDMFVVDDSVSKPILARIKTYNWEGAGKYAADNLLDGKDWLLIRGKYLQNFSMISISRLRCLTRPELNDGFKF